MRVHNPPCGINRGINRFYYKLKTKPVGKITDRKYPIKKGKSQPFPANEKTPWFYFRYRQQAE